MQKQRTARTQQGVGLGSIALQEWKYRCHVESLAVSVLSATQERGGPQHDDNGPVAFLVVSDCHPL